MVMPVMLMGIVNAAAADYNEKEEKDDHEGNHVNDYNDPRLKFRVNISSIHLVHKFHPINLCVHQSLKSLP